MDIIKQLFKLTPEELRIVCAKATGQWKLVDKLKHNGEWKYAPTWVQRKFYDGQPEDYCAAGQVMGASPPNWPGDLNLMHELENGLPVPFGANEYASILQEVCTACGTPLWRATAKQRCIAYTAFMDKTFTK